MSCDKKNRNEDAVKLAKAKLDEVTAALAEATKQEKDEEKKHADAEAGFIMFVVSSTALGLVSRCRIPTAAVAQRGFRILLGSPVHSGIITDVTAKFDEDIYPTQSSFWDGPVPTSGVEAGLTVQGSGRAIQGDQNSNLPYSSNVWE